MKRIIATISLLALVLVAALYLGGQNKPYAPGYGAAHAEQQAGQQTGQQTTSDQAENAASEAAGQAVQSGDSEDPANKDMILGDPEAPVTIIEYASFTCPHCARFHKEVFPKIKKNYIDTGKAKFVFREVYFDRFGLWAGMLAHCGGDMRYFGLTKMIFDDQKGWLAGGDPQKAIDNLRKFGRAAGMSDKDLDACFTDEQLAKDLVAWYQKTATADDISGTPSFVINGKKYSNMSYEDFVKAIEEALAAAGN